MSGVDKSKEVRQIVDAVTGIAVDQGKVIELGWLSLRAMAIPPDASEVQLREMRKAFFAGAQHIFATIVNMMDSDREPTQQDLQRMTLIHRELQEFIKEYVARTGDA